MSGYQSRAHLRDDIAAAKRVACGVFILGVVAPDRQAAQDALGALWSWLDAIERDAGALLENQP